MGPRMPNDPLHSWLPMSEFAGARWWKVDFHTHTPASRDYGKGPAYEQIRQVTPRDWLLDYMRAGIDAVVVTDHNTAAWIDLLASALVELDRERPDGYRPLTLFPGVEVTAHGSAHVLAVFPPGDGGAAVTGLLALVGVPATGDSDRAADKSPIEVVRTIRERGGLPILAHVDGPANSAFSAPGNTIKPLVEEAGLFAVEAIHRGWEPNADYQKVTRSWARVVGSDSHHPTAGANNARSDRAPGSAYTWVKMREPTFEALKLALLEGDVATSRFDDVVEDPNAVGHLMLEELEVSEARYAGRGEPLVARFSPWLSTVIGGRGSGKSSLVHFLRLALRRDADLTTAARTTFVDFRKIASSRKATGGLTQKTALRLTVRKDGVRYRIGWAPEAEISSLEEVAADGTWQRAAGDVSQRFPVRIFNQGQIYEMATDTLALMSLIDEAPSVDRRGWDAQWNREKAAFLELRGKRRELARQLEERPGVEGELADVRRKLALFEETQHTELLRAYQRYQRLLRIVDDWSHGIEQVESILRRAASEMEPLELDVSGFDSTNEAEAAEVAALSESRNALLALSAKVMALADDARVSSDAWLRRVTGSNFQRVADDAAAMYHALIAELATRGVQGVDQYGPLVQRRRVLEDRVRSLDGLVTTAGGVDAELETSRKRLADLRRELSARRAGFLAQVLEGNPHVHIGVVRYGDDATNAEPGFRRVLGLEGEAKFAADIRSEDGDKGGLVALYRDLPGDPIARDTALEARIEAWRSTALAACAGESTDLGGHFKNFLKERSPAVCDELMLWSPPDTLEVSYSPTGDGKKLQPIAQGSPGQQTAAILAFVLSHGTEPIILDQPEDDLDNALISTLIVTQLRAIRSKRQVIVVTHNANIVVNGSAEQIIVMENSKGQCRRRGEGTLADPDVRTSVCTIMEGGQVAFERRYRRMRIGDGSV